MTTRLWILVLWIVTITALGLGSVTLRGEDRALVRRPPSEVKRALDVIHVPPAEFGEAWSDANLGTAPSDPLVECADLRFDTVAEGDRRGLARAAEGSRSTSTVVYRIVAFVDEATATKAVGKITGPRSIDCIAAQVDSAADARMRRPEIPSADEAVALQFATMGTSSVNEETMAVPAQLVLMLVRQGPYLALFAAVSVNEVVAQETLESAAELLIRQLPTE